MTAGVILNRDGVSPSEMVLPLCLCVCGSIMMMCSGIDSSIGRRLEAGAGDMRQRQRQPRRVQRQTRRCRRLGCGMGGAGPSSGACPRWRLRLRLRLRLHRLLNRRRCGAMQRGTGTWRCSRRHWRQLDAGTWLVLVVLMLLLRFDDCDRLCRIGGMRHPRLLNPLHLHCFACLFVLSRAGEDVSHESKIGDACRCGLGWAGLGTASMGCGSTGRDLTTRWWSAPCQGARKGSSKHGREGSAE